MKIVRLPATALLTLSSSVTLAWAIDSAPLASHHEASHQIAASLTEAGEGLSRLAEQIRELKTQRERAASLTETLAAITLEKAALEEKLLGYEAALSRNRHLEHRLSEASRDASAYREETERLRRDFKQSLNALARSQDRLHGLTNENTTLEAALAALRAAHDAQATTVVSLQAAAVREERAREAAEAALGQALRERDAHAAASDEARAAAEKTTLALSQARKDWLAAESALSSSLAKERAEKASLLGENGTLRSELDTTRRLHAEASQRIKEEAAALSQSRIDLSRSQERLRTVEDALTRAEVARTALIEKQQVTAVALQAAQNDSDSWKLQFAALDKRLRESQEGAEARKKRDAELTTLRERAEAEERSRLIFQTENDAFRTQIEALQTTVETLGQMEERLAEARRALTEQRQQNSALNLRLKDKEKAREQNRIAFQSEQARLEAELETAIATKSKLLQDFLRIDPIRYELNSAEIDSEQARVLRQVEKILSLYPQATFEISGHTCTLGSEADNMALSEQRARRLRDFLASNGVQPEQMTAAGFGQSRPIASNDTDAGRRQNRRVEIVVGSADGTALPRSEN